MEYSSSVQTTSWFRDRYREGTLVLSPPFQRKPVWTARQKCYLVESILMRLPVPEIYVQQISSPGGETTYVIVDGQQRIRAVLQFIGSEMDPEEAEYNKFALDKLATTSPFRNLSFADMADDQKSSFYGYQFAVRYLNTEDVAEISDMFTRLNRFLAPLKPQELRNATYAGPFAALASKLADDEYWAENRIVSPALIRRMNDVEFVSELLIGVMHGPQGGSPKIIDSYYEQYEDYEDEFPAQTQTRRLFQRTLATVRELLPDIKETRWSNKTDFYTLFICTASCLKNIEIPKGKFRTLRKVLDSFEDEIGLRLADENAKVPEQAIEYVRAVEKGANEKLRRARRHLALTDVFRQVLPLKT